MSYYSEQSIDTRTCGQADEDAWLDRRDGIVTRERVFADLSAQRAEAAYAGRPQVTTAEQAAVLAKDLINAVTDGNDAEARRVALALRPYMHLLRERV